MRACVSVEQMTLSQIAGMVTVALFPFVVLFFAAYDSLRAKLLTLVEVAVGPFLPILRPIADLISPAVDFLECLGFLADLAEVLSALL